MPDQPLAVLVSGGLDSAILLGQALRHYPAVYPIYVRFGLVWEPVERAYLERFLDVVAGPRLRPLVVLEQPVADLYGAHWSITGAGAPDATTPDAAMFLQGRNVLLLAKPLLWCHANGVRGLALGALRTNPFPDATTRFFRKMQDVVNQAVGGQVEVRVPFGGMDKAAVMRLGEGLALKETFSCIQPLVELHCGRCNKCAERQRAFADAGMVDPTRYALAG